MLTLYKKEIREVWNLLAHQYNLSTQLKTTLSHPKVPCAMNIFIILYFKPKAKKIKIIHDQCTLNIPTTWKCGIRTNFITVTKEIDIQSRFWRALWNLLWTEEQSHSPVKFQSLLSHIALDIFVSPLPSEMKKLTNRWIINSFWSKKYSVTVIERKGDGYS